MTNLISCPCGHTLGRHDVVGCHGVYASDDCVCPLTPSQALDAAVAAERRPGPPIEDFSEAEEAFV